MREAASRGFYLSSVAPFGCRKVDVSDGGKRSRVASSDDSESSVRRLDRG